MPEDKGEHVRGGFKGEFCAQAACPKCDDCFHTKDYRKVCEPSPSWERHLRLIRYGGKEDPTNWTTRPYGHEAHHILCIACVNRKILANQYIEPVVQETKWCINGSTNMLAMPLWGHTIQHYCDLSTDSVQFHEALGPGGYFSTVSEPPFKNIPMHNFGHPSFNKEVNTKLQKISNKIAKGKKNHKKNLDDKLKGALDNASNEFRGMLKTRGIRRGGTHMGWHIGLNNRSTSSGWYEPFSMAENPRKITFPARKSFAGEMGKKLENLVEAFGWGG